MRISKLILHGTSKLVFGQVVGKSGRETGKEMGMPAGQTYAAAGLVVIAEGTGRRRGREREPERQRKERERDGEGGGGESGVSLSRQPWSPEEGLWTWDAGL